MDELSCDICGNTPIRAQILLEGAKLLACARCMKSGKIIHLFSDEESAGGILKARPAYLPPSAATDEEIVENWGAVIRKARQKANLTIEELASRISERANYMHAIENGRIMPTLETAKKIEKELKIKLIEKPEAGGSANLSAAKSFKEPTLEDMLEQE